MMTPLEARLTEEVATLRARNREQEIIIKLLREKVDLLVRKIFGKSSEALDDKQLLLLLQGSDGAKKAEASQADVTALEAEIANNDKAAHSSKKPRKEREVRVPDSLPVGETITLLPDEVKANPEAYRHVNDEVTVQLDFSPGRFTKRLIIRPKYVKKEAPHKAPIIAELPLIMERCKGAPGLISQIIVSKYCDHLPLYRQEQIYRLRHGIELPRQTMARWIAWAARSLVPLYEQLHTGALAGGYVQVDETMIEYLEPGNGQTKNGYLWTIKRPGGDAVFVWKTNRAEASLANIIPANFIGTLGCDGYIVYQNHAQKSAGRIQLAGCWAHVRRKFDEAKEATPMAALTLIKQIQNLYLIERKLRASKASPKLRAVARSYESRPIIQRIDKLLNKWKSKPDYLPQSLIGKAIAYTLNLWTMLQTYVENGQIEIDNNLVENAIRPTAIGKKNWLFIGEAGAGDSSAILFTLIEACRSRSIDPWTYITDVLNRLPTMKITQVRDVLPEAWAKEQREKKRQMASAALAATVAAS